MIETTFIRLETAADMLGTDADTLLIAAAEKRIRLYGLLNQSRTLQRLSFIRDTDGEVCRVDSVDDFQGMIDFIPIDSESAAEVLRIGDTGFFDAFHADDESGDLWEVNQDIDGGGDPLEDSDKKLRIQRANIFAKRKSIEAIRDAHKTPEAGAIQEPHGLPRIKSAETRSRDTLLSIINAMADQLGIDPTERGIAARIAEWTEHVGAPVGEETIKKYLNMIPATIEKRSR